MDSEKEEVPVGDDITARCTRLGGFDGSQQDFCKDTWTIING